VRWTSPVCSRAIRVRPSSPRRNPTRRSCPRDDCPSEFLRSPLLPSTGTASKAAFAISIATSHVCDLRVVSAAIVVPSSVPKIWTQGCRHTGGGHTHSAGTLGLSSRLRPLPPGVLPSGSPSAISLPGNGPFSSNGPIAAFAKRSSSCTLSPKQCSRPRNSEQPQRHLMPGAAHASALARRTHRSTFRVST